MTLFNRGDLPFQDWFAAIQIKKAYVGFKIYTDSMEQSYQTYTILFFIKGLLGLKHLLANVNGHILHLQGYQENSNQ